MEAIAVVRFSGVSQRSSLLPESNCAHTEYTPHCQLRLQAQTFQTPALAAFDIEVDANSYFPELLLAVATVDVACPYCTLAIGAGNGGYANEATPCWSCDLQKLLQRCHHSCLSLA